MDILYFDNHIIVVNKPAGIPTESTEGKSLESDVKQWAKEKYGKQGDVFLHAAHRLDKPVSGIVLFAKTSKALQRLHESFRSRNIQKTYVALLEGEIKEEEGVLKDYLVHEEFYSSISSEEDLRSKLAILSYTLRNKKNGRSIVEVDLHTGRYHQIRSQFSSRGHPVVNDLKYGARQVADPQAIALHHEKFTFNHPVSKEKLSFQSSFPEHWQAMLGI